MSIAEIQQPKYPNDRIDPRIEQALNEINRRAFVSCEREGLVVGRSIPSTETLRHIFSVLTLPPKPQRFTSWCWSRLCQRRTISCCP